MDGLDAFQCAIAQVHIKAVQILTELLQAGGANQGAGHEGAAEDECQRQLSRGQARLLGQLHIGLGRLLGLRTGVAAESTVERVACEAGADRLGAVEVLAGQGAESQWGIGQQAYAFPMAELCQAALVSAIEQAVGVLDADDPR